MSTNEKEIKAIELLIEGNKFQDAVHKINELAYSYLDKDIDCNFMHDISTTFAVKETIMNLIDDEYKISKRSKIKIDDIKELNSIKLKILKIWMYYKKLKIAELKLPILKH